MVRAKRVKKSFKPKTLRQRLPMVDLRRIIREFAEPVFNVGDRIEPGWFCDKLCRSHVGHELFYNGSLQCSEWGCSVKNPLR